MRKFNDYINLIRCYLRDWQNYEDCLRNADAAVKELDTQMSGGDLKATSYGNIGGGNSGVNGVEHSAIKRLELLGKRNRILADSEDVKRHMARLVSAMNELDKEERGIIKERYIQKMDYAALSRRHHYTDRWCKKLVYDAERKMAVSFFGPVAEQDIYFLVNNK